MSLLKQNTTKKGRVDKKIATQLKFKFSNNNKKYKVKDICDRADYIKESKSGYLLGFYYLTSWKSYFKDENT